jgi:hypothetical protein
MGKRPGIVVNRDTLERHKLLDNLLQAVREKEPTLFKRLEKVRKKSSNPDDLIKALIGALNHRRTEVKVAAAWLLGFFGQAAPRFFGDLSPEIERVIAALRQAIKSPREDVREQSVLALRDFGWYSSVLVAGILIDVITKPRELPFIVEQAIDGLGDCGLDAAAETVPVLGGLLMNPAANTTVRLKACNALQELAREPEAVDALTNIVARGGTKPDDRRVRIEAVKALNRRGVLYDALRALAPDSFAREEVLSLVRDAGRVAAAAHLQLKKAWAPSTKPKEAVPEERSDHPPLTSQTCPVVLKGPNTGPIVLGVQQEPLTQSQYDVVKALVGVFPKGQKLAELIRNGKHGGVRDILRLLRNQSQQWAQVIVFPGSSGGGYRVAIPDSA